MKADRCRGYMIESPDGDEFDCGYGTVITCDECKFVVGPESGDMRRGKDPAAAVNQDCG